MTAAPISPAAQLALGRIFRLLSRPTRQGDAEAYEAARRVVLTEADAAGIDTWPRERHQLPPYGWNRGVVE